MRRVSFRCDSRKRVWDGKSVLNLLERRSEHPAWPTRWRSTRYTCCTRFIMCFFWGILRKDEMISWTCLFSAGESYMFEYLIISLFLWKHASFHFGGSFFVTKKSQKHNPKLPNTLWGQLFLPFSQWLPLQSLAPRGLVQRYLPNPLLVKASGGEANGELWRKLWLCVFLLMWFLLMDEEVLEVLKEHSDIAVMSGLIALKYWLD